MTKDEFQKAVDDVITDCIRNDYSFGSYAHKMTEAVWPVLEAAEKAALEQARLNGMDSEREACAVICDTEGHEWDSDDVVTEKNYAAHCAAAIRSRGNQ